MTNTPPPQDPRPQTQGSDGTGRNSGVLVLGWAVTATALLVVLLLAGGSFPAFKTQEQREKEAVEAARAEMKGHLDDYKYHTREAEKYEAMCRLLSNKDNPQCSPEEE
jgi:uncharacterized protein HemX